MLVKTLEEIEEEILKKADGFKVARTAFQEAESNLTREVQAYQKERERLQREAWKKENLGWCHKCYLFYSQEFMRLLYAEGRERRDLSKRVISYCNNCAEAILSCPRDKNEFQCYKAKQKKDGFVIFVSGQWIPIPEPEHTLIEIERGYIPEEDNRFGKSIECSGWPNLYLKIERRKIL